MVLGTAAKEKEALRLCGGDNETSGLIYGHLFVGESLAFYYYEEVVGLFVMDCTLAPE